MVDSESDLAHWDMPRANRSNQFFCSRTVWTSISSSLKALLDDLIQSKELSRRREADCRTKFSVNGRDGEGGIENSICISLTMLRPPSLAQWVFSILSSVLRSVSFLSKLLYFDLHDAALDRLSNAFVIADCLSSDSPLTSGTSKDSWLLHIVILIELLALV